jgi:N-formylglutamate deformylase
MNVFRMAVGEGPLVAAAIHDGHAIRPEVAKRLALNESQRLQEEDPFTEQLIEPFPTRLVGDRSRFEADLNRPRDKAVYLTPEDAWGLEIWTRPLPVEAVERSLANYDLFYATAEALLKQLVAIHDRIVLLDIHSYNYRREGADAPPALKETHPEINIGTGLMDRKRWEDVINPFIAALREYDAGVGEASGGRLDVRENVKFKGGELCRWIHRQFPESVCAIAVEFKKTFMDEWTGELDGGKLGVLRDALASTAPVLLQALATTKYKAPS